MNIVSQHNKSFTKSSQDIIQQRMHQVLKYAKQKGATDAAVSVNADCGFSVDVRMQATENILFTDSQSVGVTVYIGAQKGSASSSDVSVQALEEMVTAAYNIASVSAKDPCFGLPDLADIDYNYPYLDLHHPWDISPQDAIDIALKCESIALSADSRIINSDGVNIASHTSYEGYATTQGFVGLVDSSSHSISCSLLASDKKGMQRDYDYTSARSPKDLLSIEELAKSVVERTTARLNAKRLPTKRLPVLFSSRLSAGLFSAFIAAISGSSLYRRQSFLCDTKGEALFPQHIKIYEQPHLLRGLGSSPFDDEGIVTRPNILVEQGVLQQYVLGSYSARKLGLATTANAGGVFNLTIDPTSGNLKELLRQMDTGFLVTELMGQGVNGLTGDYSRGASGFWVQGGEVQYPVEEVTIAGNLKHMFQGMIAVGCDTNPSYATRVGSVLIDDMMVAGT